MKKIISILCILCFTANAIGQIKNSTRVSNRAINTQVIQKPTLNYYQIETNMKNNVKCYSVVTTINAIDEKNQNIAGFSNHILKRKNNYLYGDYKRLTSNSSGNNKIEFTISPKSDLHAEIDKTNILVSYGGELESRTYKLKNVTILRSKKNIMITGSIIHRGTTFGVSICVVEGDCVI